jgi:antitoxin component YwqK of YwqJK toxin-antitoxin module
LRASRRLIAAAAVAMSLDAAAVETLNVRGACRDGVPHGVYELSMPGGRVRVLGAFNRGKRTSSFLYWTSSGVRVAHIPYDEGAFNGTVALWYASAAPGREPQQKLEAAYAKGALHGAKRSWYPNGRPRGDYGYDAGVLVTARAWQASGTPLGEAAARAQAARDAEEDARYYATLDAIVDGNLPGCDAGGMKT